MSVQHHQLQANGLRFHVLVQGPAQGPLALLLHGFPEGAESWLPQMESLAGAGFLAAAPDLRGYGLTDCPEGVDAYRLDQLVEDARALVQGFGRGQAHVAGHDWGAIVGWRLVARHPDLLLTWSALSVPHLVPLAAASREDEDQQLRSSYVRLFRMEGKAEEVLSRDEFSSLRAMFGLGPNPDAVPEPTIEHFARNLARPGRLTAALNYYRANLAGDHWDRLLSDMEPIHTPTQLIWGAHDPALGRRAVMETEKHVEGRYRLEVLEDAGHWLQFEKPAEVSRLLIEWMSRSVPSQKSVGNSSA
ncbi:MAG TPA: alpha/beta hydrolase [Candidatus Acidoferrales bacterium]|nr:alpha/beta hydrolase [Candidatus Acidoferrales bacterium]